MQVRGTSVTVVYIDYNQGFTWTIDGIAQTAVTITGTVNPKAVTVSGLSAGNHTIVITTAAISGGIGCNICGIQGANATGARLDNYALAGATSGTWLQSSGTPLALVYPGAQGSLTGIADLVIYELWGNDVLSNVAPDTWVSNVQQSLAAVTDTYYTGGGTLTSTPDVLFLASMAGIAADTHFLIQEYMARFRGLAESYGAAFLNIGAQFGQSFARWNGLSYAGNSSAPNIAGTNADHPSSQGHAYMAAQLESLIIP